MFSKHTERPVHRPPFTVCWGEFWNQQKRFQTSYAVYKNWTHQSQQEDFIQSMWSCNSLGINDLQQLCLDYFASNLKRENVEYKLKLLQAS